MERRLKTSKRETVGRNRALKAKNINAASLDEGQSGRRKENINVVRDQVPVHPLPQESILVVVLRRRSVIRSDKAAI